MMKTSEKFGLFYLTVNIINNTALEPKDKKKK